MNVLMYTVLVLATLLIMPAACIGGGVLHVFPPEFGSQKFAVARPIVLTSRTMLTVSETSLKRIANQTFLNDNEFPVKGLYILPLDSTRNYQNLEIRIDGVSVRPQVLNSSKAIVKLEELTKQMHDPFLLRFAGNRLVLVEPVTMSVNGKRTITVKYTESIFRTEDRLQLRVRSDGERYSLAPVEEMEVRVRFKMSRSVGSVLSPSHHLKIIRETPQRCTCIIKMRRSKVRKDVQLLALFSEDRPGVHILTHKLGKGPGTFMAVITPPTTRTEEILQGKQVVFILDSSGSMGRANHDMAKQAIIAGIQRLRPGDRFNVINMSTHTEQLADHLIPATDSNLLRAVRFVDFREPGGGTDLYNALVKALLLFNRKKRPGFVLVAADGRATVGVINSQKIINDLASLNRYKARIFSLAFGREAEVPILSKLAEQTGGKLTYVREKDGASSMLDRFLARLSLPQVSNISLDFRGIVPLELIPNPIPDLFRGDTRVVLGRYTARKDVQVAVTLRSIIEGSIRTKVKSVTFPRKNPEYSYLPAIWAMRKLGKILEERELERKKHTLKTQMEMLTNRFGFRYPLNQRTFGLEMNKSESPTNVGALIWLLKTSLVASDIESPTCTQIGGKVFCIDGLKWVDREYSSSMPSSNMTFLSKEYFKKLESDPKLGVYFALGPNVTVVRNGTAVEVQTKP
jgi:hypothetical protein